MRKTSVLVLLLLALLFVQFTYSSNTYSWKLGDLSLANIDAHVRFFTGLESRFTGYPGYYNAVDYIYSYLQSLGLKPQLEYFDVVIPYEEYAYIKLESGEVIKAHMLFPEIPYTGSANLSGRLVYVGSASLKELSGVQLNGCIAVIEFDSLWEWRVLPLLGAKAVVFIEHYSPSRVHYRNIAGYKLAPLPLSFTRLYVTKEYRNTLIEASKKGLRAEISCKMTWRKVKAANILAVIRGTDPALQKEYIVLTAHFDSFSVVPALAPGATDSIGISVLLEVARLLSQNPAPRSVVIAAFSGHWQFLAGARDFAEKRLSEALENRGFAKNIKLMIELDLSTVSNALSARNFGYGYWIINTETGALIKYSWLKSLLDKACSELEAETGEKYCFHNVLMAAPPLEEGLWQALINLMTELGDLYPAQLDIEPWTVAGGLGIALRTVKSFYTYLLTPFDTYDKLNYWNLVPQLKLVSAILSHVLSTPKWSMLAQPKYSRFTPPDMGLCKLVVRVLKYDIRTATYLPAPGVLVMAGGGRGERWMPTAAGIRYPFLLIGITDENGEICFNGVRYSMTYTALVFAIDEKDRIVGVGPYAGPGAIPRTFVVAYNETSVLTVAISYNVSTIEVYGAFIQTSMTLPITYMVYDARTHYIPQPFQYLFAYDFYDAVLFVPSNTPVEVLALQSGAYFGVGLTGVSSSFYTWTLLPPAGIIAGISKPAPEGPGFTLKRGEVLRIPYGPLRFAQETWFLDEYRLQPVKWTNASTQALALTFHKLAGKEIARSKEYLERGELGKAVARMHVAWFYEANAYQATRALIMDILQMSAIYVLLLVPFIYLLTNLVYREKWTRRKIFFASLLTVFAIGLFIVIHPVAVLATNTFMIIGGYLALSFGLILAFIAFSRTYGQLREIRRERIGIHFIERERTSIIEALTEVSLGYMNRRPIRTALTLLSIICVGFALLSFSSLSVSVRPIYVKVPGETTYRGALFRTIDYGTIPLSTADMLEVMFRDKATISVRAWLYPPGGEIYLTRVISKGESLVVKKALLRAILAVSPEEREVTKMNETLIAGEWFDPWDYRVCIVSDYIAKSLDLNRGDTVDLLGVRLVVKGIFDSKLLNAIHDIDRTQLTPIDLRVPGVQERALAAYVILIPYSLAKDFILSQGFASSLEEIATRPGIRSIAFIPKKDVGFSELVEEIALVTQGTLWVCDGREVYVVSVTPGVRLLGSAEVAVVVVLAVLVLFTTILNSIAERVKEIGILSSLGLSPSHIAQLYIFEMVIYSVLGGVLAYIVSLGLVAGLALLNIPTMGLYANYTASGTLLVFGIMFFSILSTALYPAYKASKLVTPSLERKWKISTKPRGDVWNIPLPLRLASKLEAVAFLEYIREYLDYRRVERVGTYQVLKYELRPGKDNTLAEIIAECQLAPWDYGIRQFVYLKCFKLEEGYNFELILKRLTGPYSSWIISNKSLVGDIRLQILMWRSLRDNEKERYLRKGRSLLERWRL